MVQRYGSLYLVEILDRAEKPNFISIALKQETIDFIHDALYPTCLLQYQAPILCRFDMGANILYLQNLSELILPKSSSFLSGDGTVSSVIELCIV